MVFKENSPTSQNEGGGGHGREEQKFFSEDILEAEEKIVSKIIKELPQKLHDAVQTGEKELRVARIGVPRENDETPSVRWNYPPYKRLVKSLKDMGSYTYEKTVQREKPPVTKNPDDVLTSTDVFIVARVS